MDFWKSEVKTPGGLLRLLDPVARMIASLLVIAVIMAVPAANWRMCSVFLLGVALLGIVAKVPLKPVAVRLLYVLPLLVFIAVSLIIFKPAPPDGRSGVLWGLAIKTGAIYLCLALLSVTTDFYQMLIALKRLRVPAPVLTVLSFAYRYVFLFLAEAQRLRWAIQSRGGDSLTRRRQVVLAGGLMTHLLTRVLDRGDWIYAAMLSRGFEGRLPLAGSLEARDSVCEGGAGMAEMVLEVKGLDFSYPDNTQALRGIDFELHEHETVGLVGPNGAGKSTFMLHLNGVLRGDGLIRVLGMDVNRENLRRIRKQVGIVFQDPNDQLFMPTVRDDVAFGPLCFGMDPADVELRVDEILRKLDLTGVKNKPAHRLSLGERKRAALATILVMEPRIVVLDEPSVSLDPLSRRNFIDLVKEIAAATVIVSHDLDLVNELCHRVVLMEKGRIIACGATGEILGDEDLLRMHQLEIPLSVKLARALSHPSGEEPGAGTGSC